MGGVAEVEAAMAGGGGEEEGAGDDGLGPEVGERGVGGAFGEDDGGYGRFEVQSEDGLERIIRCVKL